MIGTSQLINAFGAPVCFTDTTDIFKDGSGVALYGLDYDGSDAGGASGKFGEAAIFNGSSSRIELPSISGLPSNSNNTNDFTFSCWVRSTTERLNNGGGSNPIFQNYVGSYQFIGFGGNDNGNFPNGKLFYYTYGGSGYHNSWIITSNSYADGQWHHLVVTDKYNSGTDNRTRTIYVDGVQKDQDTVDKNFNNNGESTLLIGDAAGTSSNHLDADIDQVRIWTSALTQTQINQLYLENSSTVGTHLFGCVANYNLDGNAKESMGTTAYDGTETDVTYRYDGTPTSVDFGIGGQTNTGIRYSASSSSTITTPLSNSNFTSNYSISLWVNLNNANAFQNFVGNYKSSGGYGGFTFMSRDVGSGVYRYGFIWWYNTGDLYNYVDNNDVVATSGQWAHLVLTKTSGALPILYVNGTANSLNYRNTVTDHAATTENFKIGNTLNTNLQAGSIDQVRVFSKALSSAEVGKLYGNGAGEVACAHTSTTDNVAYPIANTAYYKLDNNSKDSARSTGKFNEGAVFNGSSSKISTPITSTNIGTSFTLSCWVNVDAASDNYHVPIGNYTSSGGWFMSMDNNMKFGFYNLNGGTGTSYTSTATYEYGGWYHFCVVFTNNSDLKVFINGNKETNSQSVAAGTNSNGIQIGVIGTYSSATNTEFDGKIDQVRIFNTALSDSDVSNLYAETVSDTSTLSFPSGKTAIATYQLNGNSTDLSGNYNGTDTNVTYAYDGVETDIEYRFGRFGQAAVLNGSSSLMTITDGGIGANGTARVSFSVSLWIKTTASNQSAIISDYGTNYGFYIQMESSASGGAGKLSIASNYSGGLNYRTAGTAAINDGNWHHLVLVNNTSDNTQKLYIDGNTTPAISHSLSTGTKTANAIQVGYYTGYVGQYNFNGNIDQIRLFSSALSSSQVTQLYNEKPEVDTSNFKTVLYDGSGGAQYISNVGFQPDFTWIKSRTSNSYPNNVLQDSVRGANQYIISESSGQQYTNSTFGSFDANGFTLTSGNVTWNGSGSDYVAWNWKAGGPAVSNTDGTIASQVSANQAAGFSIVRNTGTSNYSDTIGHGLSQAPEIIIQKGLGNSVDWYVLFNIDGTGGWDYAKLNTTDAFGPDNPVRFGTSSTTINNWGWTNYDMINYCWHSVAGYSKIGTYTGGGTTKRIYVDSNDDGTGTGGFKPSFVMIKASSSLGGNQTYGSWVIHDDKRAIESTDNVTNPLYANRNYQEGLRGQGSSGSGVLDLAFNDDGFTINHNGYEANGSGIAYIYMAFK